MFSTGQADFRFRYITNELKDKAFYMDSFFANNRNFIPFK